VEARTSAADVVRSAHALEDARDLDTFAASVR